MEDTLRIRILEYSVKTTTTLCNKIMLESELNRLKTKLNKDDTFNNK